MLLGVMSYAMTSVLDDHLGTMTKRWSVMICHDREVMQMLHSLDLVQGHVQNPTRHRSCFQLLLSPYMIM